MFSTSRFVVIFAGVFIVLNAFSYAAFHRRPVARFFSLSLAGSALEGAELAGRNLTASRFADAKLSRADLSGAVLDSADLRKAHLGAADLSGASLADADLSGADLWGADLRGADLRDARGLTWDQVEVAQRDEGTIPPEPLREFFENAKLPEIEPTEVDIPLDFSPNKVALSADGAVLAAVGETNGVRLWRVSKDLDAERKLVAEPIQSPTGLEGEGRSVSLSAGDAKLVAAGSDTGAIYIWRVGEQAPFKTLNEGASEGYVFNLKFSPDGLELFSASHYENAYEKTAHAWNVAEGNAGASAHVGREERVLDLDSKRRLILTATAAISWTGRLRSIDDGSVVSEFTGDIGDVTVGAFNREGKLIVVGDRKVIGVFGPRGEVPNTRTGGAVSIWELDGNTMRRLAAGNVEGAYPLSLAFSPDGRILAGGLADGSVTLWRLNDLRPLITFSAHSKRVVSLNFGADWRTLASAGDDRMVKLWHFTLK